MRKIVTKFTKLYGSKFGKNLNLANQLTILRIFIIFPMVFLLYFDGAIINFFAALLFTIASITDFIDGYIARTANLVTSFGKFLDPLADKLLIMSALVMLVDLERVEAWVAILILAREFAVTGLRAIAADAGQVIAADKFGKWKTIMQTIAIIPLILYYPYFSLPIYQIGTVLLYIALILTLFSGINYFYAFYKDWKGDSSSNI